MIYLLSLVDKCLPLSHIIDHKLLRRITLTALQLAQLPIYCRLLDNQFVDKIKICHQTYIYIITMYVLDR